MKAKKMSNIFEGAKFCDTFKTKGGRKAIYNGCENKWHYLILEGGWGIICHDDGLDTINDHDIVGRWDEPIDEKHLDNMASQLADDYCKSKNCGHILPNDCEIANDCVLIGLKKGFGLC